MHQTMTLPLETPYVSMLLWPRCPPTLVPNVAETSDIPLQPENRDFTCNSKS